MTSADLTPTLRELELSPPHEGVRLYCLTAAYPRLEWTSPRRPTALEAVALRRINKYYIDLAADYAIRAGRAWRASERRRLAREGEAYRPRHLAQTVEVTLSDRHLFVLTTRRERLQPNGAPLRTDRFADCFDLATGRLLPFEEVFSRPEAARRAADIEAAARLAARAALPGGSPHPKAVRRALKKPDPHGFWRGLRGNFQLLIPPGRLADAKEGAVKVGLSQEWGEKYYG